MQLAVQYNLLSYPEDVIILDSSTKKKFSSHLIFTKVVFENNQHCGAFVKNLVDKFSNEELGIFSSIDSHNNKKMIVDCSVYSVNQNFRLIFSSKFGKNSPLIVSRNNQFVIKDGQLQLFLDSLVSDKNLVVNTFSADSNPEFESTTIIECPPVSNNPSLPSKLTEIKSLLKTLIKPGTISDIKFYENKGRSSMIIFEIRNFKFCQNIQREHKKNNIYYVCDVNKSVMYQKCYDLNCSGYRSPDIPLNL